ncbi:MAG: ImmA/IrrE family metallo-endopeptidase [Ruminococcaceae bacterium]|jgi:Zn-dependent peptidase ImmA (M78 family)|nr:ImmA/IrrE family metallo-endopeptidase [Oscillospiraceae bacterium]
MSKNKIELYLEEFQLSNETDALIFEIDGYYTILLNSLCFHSNAEIRTAIAHEIGHCMTGSTHRVSSPLDLIEKHEFQANKWAAERYLPFCELRKAMYNGYTEVWQLADYFNFTDEFVRWALHYYTENCGLSFNEAS